MIYGNISGHNGPQCFGSNFKWEPQLVGDTTHLSLLPESPTSTYMGFLITDFLAHLLQGSFQLLPQPLLTPASIAQGLTDTLRGYIVVAPLACLQTLCCGLGTCLEVVAFTAAVHSLGPHRVFFAKYHPILGSLREPTGKS